MKNRQSHIIASVGTVIVAVLIFLLLWFVCVHYVREPENEGILVSFGDVDQGGGVSTGLMAANAAPEQTAPPPVHAAPSNNEWMVQDEEDNLALTRQREEDSRRKAEAERLQREKAEAERMEAERIAREKRIAEQKAKEQAAIDKAQQFGALFGNTDSEEGAHGVAGESASSATKGNPMGHGSIGGNEWSLNGRSLKGRLPLPADNFKQEGVVVVNIIVDAQGKVVSATPGKGTTISDETTRQLAVKAARKAEFNMVDRPDKAMGTITYHFKLR